MLIPRLIPCLLLEDKGLVKTAKFKDPVYVGDPINAIKIFNEKGADELILLDIQATTKGLSPNLELIAEIASECFMPVCYGGGIKSLEDARQIFNLGVEKVALSSAAIANENLVVDLVKHFGGQSIVVCLDVKKNMFGQYEVVTHQAKKKTGLNPLDLASRMQSLGAGELLINAVDRDGTGTGFDMDLIRMIASRINIPLIACGGAASLQDVKKVVCEAGASSAAAGSMFVFHGKHRGVLINYPSRQDIDALFQEEVHEHSS